MIKIKASTKKGQDMLYRARQNKGFCLAQAYKTYSNAKLKAWQDCYDKCDIENGTNFHICSCNTFGFSVAWDVAGGVRIETPQNSYFVAL